MHTVSPDHSREFGKAAWEHGSSRLSALVADFAMTEIDEVVFRSISGPAEDARVPSGRDRSSRVAISGVAGIAQVSSSMRL
jgi:hypothetical protein